MKVFPRGREGWLYVRVPTRDGRSITRTTGTTDAKTAKQTARMLDELGPRGRRDELVDAIALGDLAIPRLYDAYIANDLDGVRARLRDIDLSPLVDEWLYSVATALAPETTERYMLYVRSLIPADAPFPRSQLTAACIQQWISSRPVAPPTQRKYRACLSSFCQYLVVQTGVLTHNPVRDTIAPSPGDARDRHIEMAEILALADEQEEPYRTLAILLHATGLDLSVALRLKRRDVDVSRREIVSKRTKTRRNVARRSPKVADWAWPYVERHIALLTPNAPLFAGINRWTASDKHRAACAAVGIEDYWLRDSRHTYAVRAIRAGASIEFVAEQLGHANTTMVLDVYGRYRPDETERTAWERRAAEQDAERARSTG
jgi:integrase